MAISSRGRPRRSRIYIIVGAVLAVLAFGTAAAVASLPLLSSGPTGTRVVVAKNSIAARTRIQASDLELKVISPTPPLSFTDLATVAGKGARVDIPAGAPVTANLITQSSDQLSSSDVTFLPIPSGYVAVTVPTSEQVGVAGYVQVGDRINVLATISTAAFVSGPSAPVVRTVFKDLNIIRVGPISAPQSGSGQVTSSLTALVTSCDAEYLFWLLNNAVLKYELESFSDYGATPTKADPSCPNVAAAGGVGPREVNGRWHFTTP
ncbi:MAG: Flp pilus assembly protein CpaB [Candidatus Dormibacteraeota bacterium]|nr:Flp pilus assembly protein CpaB [Candidatus Dormibacteraeota bacterium]